ncbi:hypothetical protein LSCM1_04778 [Leishmania martiniquensis]|uniref:Uncharacterized protein n=1 Tax=Leishmania martiniquensis TaxID=1580590 RepID=A0A836KNF0_9TRYP|nr:hypothetical protein LSCM1_04778 [Leishmania martiniquensis]
MSGPPHSSLHVPPLPRYRYHPQSGAWRRERVPEDGARAGTATNTCVGASSPAPGPTPGEPFESTFDYFLRSLRPPVRRAPAAEREERLRQPTNAKLREFEMHSLPKAATATQYKMRRLTITDHRSTATDDDHSTASAFRTSGPLHPLVGYASTASLPAVYAALVKVMGRALSFAAEAQEDRLSRESFRELLAFIGPAEILSIEYSASMFTSLPSYDADSDTVEALSTFTLLMEHRYHPRLITNVEALFEAFDTEAEGVVPAEVLYPDVLMAWAAQHTFGNLRDQWQRFAAIIEEERGSCANALPLMPPLASHTAIRAALCSTPAIYAAACSLDLDGGSL